MDANIDPRVLDAIDEAVERGIPLQYIAYGLVVAGWPQGLVNESINEWLRLNAHGRMGKRTEFTDWLKKYKRAARKYVYILTAVNLVTSTLVLIRPWPTKVLTDSVFGQEPAPWLLEPYSQTSALILITSSLMLMIFLAGWLTGTFKDYLILWFGFRLNRALKRESFEHILHLPLYHQKRLAKGDYVYRQNIVTNSLADLILGTTSSIIESCIIIVGVLIVMVMLSVKLTLIGVILVPFIYLIMRYYSPKVAKYGRALNENASQTASATTESVDNAETVQAFVLEDAQLQRVDRLWVRQYQLSKQILVLSRLFRGSNSLLIVIGTSTVMYFGGGMALEGKISLGELLIFMTYMGFLLSPIENLASQFAVRGQKVIDIHRVFEVLSDHEGIESLRKDRHFPQTAGAVTFKNVSYAYNQVPVLNNINLQINPGEKVAFIGPSGGGKSTLLKLLPLFIEPSAGQILVSNVDIQTISLKELRQNIAWISQTPQLFNKPLIDNLTDADLHRMIMYEEINKVLAASNVNEFLPRLPLGLETPSGEGGGSLSGGQRQRVAIARALLRHAPYLCMDEPTAALDFQSENIIKDSLRYFLQGRTVMLVTHRRALLQLMDTIYVVENGGIKNVKLHGGLSAYLNRLEGTEGQGGQPDHFGRPDDIRQAGLLRRQRKVRDEAEQQRPAFDQNGHSVLNPQASIDFGGESIL